MRRADDLESAIDIAIARIPMSSRITWTLRIASEYRQTHTVLPCPCVSTDAVAVASIPPDGATRRKEEESMRKVQRRSKVRQSSEFGDPGVPCLPHAVMHSRATRVAFAQGLARSNWPMPITFIRLIAILLFGIVSARAVAEDSRSSGEPVSMRSISALRVLSGPPLIHLSVDPSSPYWRETRPKQCGAPAQSATAPPSRNRRISAIRVPVGT